MKIPFDRFAAVINLNYKSQPTFKTYSGFIFTIIFLVAVVAIFIQSFVEMLQRKNPTSNTTEMFVNDPALANIISLPMAFSLTQRTNQLQSLIVDYHYRLKAYNEEWIWYVDQTTGQYGMTVKSTPMVIKVCEESDFVGSETLVAFAKQLVDIHAFFCIPRNQSSELFDIKGKIGALGYKYVKVDFEKCIGAGCANSTEIEAALTTVNVNFGFGNSFIDINNFENPIQPSITGYYNNLNLQFWRAKFIELTPIEVNTDEGVLWSINNKKEGFLFEIAETLLDTPISDSRFTFYFRLSNKKKIVNRQYKKLQDVLAQTTGIASALGLIFFLVLQPFIKIKKNEEMINEVLMKERKTKVHISFLDFLKSLIGNKQAKAKMERFKLQTRQIEKRMDISHMMKNIFNIEKIMYFSFNDDQKLLINNALAEESAKDLDDDHELKTHLTTDPKIVKALKAIESKPKKDNIDFALLEYYRQFQISSEFDAENPAMLSFEPLTSTIQLSPVEDKRISLALQSPSTEVKDVKITPKGSQVHDINVMGL